MTKLLGAELKKMQLLSQAKGPHFCGPVRQPPENRGGKLSAASVLRRRSGAALV
jgi:hypothetical protein